MLVFAKTASTGPLGGFPVASDTVSSRVSKILIPPRRSRRGCANFLDAVIMAKTHRKLKKANHGQRPASSKARRLKRKHVKLS